MSRDTTALIFIITHMQTYFLLNPHSDRHGHLLASTTPKWFCPDHIISCRPQTPVPNNYSGLLFVPPAPEVSAEIKRTIPHSLLPFHSPIRGFHSVPFKIRFTMTFWLSHCIIFQIRNRNELTDKKFRLIFVWLFSFLTIQKIVRSSSRGPGIFGGLYASKLRPWPRTWASRPRRRTSKCVREDSNSDNSAILGRSFR